MGPSKQRYVMESFRELYVPMRKELAVFQALQVIVLTVLLPQVYQPYVGALFENVGEVWKIERSL